MKDSENRPRLETSEYEKVPVGTISAMRGVRRTYYAWQRDFKKNGELRLNALDGEIQRLRRILQQIDKAVVIDYPPPPPQPKKRREIHIYHHYDKCPHCGKTRTTDEN